MSRKTLYINILDTPTGKIETLFYS